MARTHHLSLAKKTVFAALMLLMLGAAIELLGYAGGVAVVGRQFSLPRLQRQRDALVASAGRVTFKANTRWLQDEVLHPYLGFAPPGGGPTPVGVGSTLASAPPRRAGDRVVVAFVGGSFAQVFYEQGAPHLLARLAELPMYRGKTLVPVSLGFAGYKQPQQLLSIVYLLALGAEFDLIVNIDGFNDLAIHPTENAPARVFPAYPRRWHQRMEGVLPGGALRLMLRRVQLEGRRAALAESFSTFPWRHLNVANFLYAVADRDLDRRLVETDNALLGADRSTGASAVATGPVMAFASDAEMVAYLVDLWQRGSRLLDGVARLGDARYYHFLQPNQYVPGSKPIGASEAAAASNAAYRQIVASGYPLLQKAGRALTTDGIRFVDLSRVFADHPEPLYVDSCCHVDVRGNTIVADVMFETIRRDLQDAHEPRTRPVGTRN